MRFESKSQVARFSMSSQVGLFGRKNIDTNLAHFFWPGGFLVNLFLRLWSSTTGHVQDLARVWVWQARNLSTSKCPHQELSGNTRFGQKELVRGYFKKQLKTSKGRPIKSFVRVCCSEMRLVNLKIEAKYQTVNLGTNSGGLCPNSRD